MLANVWIPAFVMMNVDLLFVDIGALKESDRHWLYVRSEWTRAGQPWGGIGLESAIESACYSSLANFWCVLPFCVLRRRLYEAPVSTAH